MARITLAVLFALLAIPAIGQSADGVFFTQRMTSGGPPITVQTQLDATRMRTEMAGPNGVTNVTIFDGGKQVLYLVDPSRKTYVEMTKADVDRLSAQVLGAAAQIQSQLEQLPPAQRTQMEGMMKGVQRVRTGSAMVGRWTCDNYDLTMGAQKIGEVCSADLTALGFNAKDFDVMLQMGAFYSALAPQLAGQLPSPAGVDPRGSPDCPIKIVMMFPGNAMTTELIEAGRRTLSDAVFAVPAGFTKQAFDGAMGGRGTGAQR